MSIKKTITKIKPIILAIIIFLLLAGTVFYFLRKSVEDSSGNQTLEDVLGLSGTQKQDMLSSVKELPAKNIQKTDTGYQVQDEKNKGVDIQTPDQKKEESASSASSADKSADAAAAKNNTLEINFPSDYTKPLEIKLDPERSITIKDNAKDKFSARLLANQLSDAKIDFPEAEKNKDEAQVNKADEKIATIQNDKYLEYQSKDKRKAVYYTYQKDDATGEAKLKNWLVYQSGDGSETESHSFTNAKLKINGSNGVDVYYSDSKTASADVSGEVAFTIPQAYYLDKDSTIVNINWEIQGENTIKLKLENLAGKYPIALDPTLEVTP